MSPFLCFLCFQTGPHGVMPLSGNILSDFRHSGFQCLLLYQQAGRALIQCFRLFLQLLPGFFPGILHRLKQEAFFLRKRFPQYILSTTIDTAPVEAPAETPRT
ncbi:hypothetical protein ACTXQV_42290 [Klebsiella pneumoniae]